MRDGLLLGRVVNPHIADVGPLDVLVQPVLGSEASTRSLAIGGLVELGDTVQFQLRNATTAAEDLREVMDGRDASGAFVTTSVGRGARLFSESDHDAGLISEALDGAPMAGMFSAGELGPVGRRSFSHHLATSVVLFG